MSFKSVDLGQLRETRIMQRFYQPQDTSTRWFVPTQQGGEATAQHQLQMPPMFGLGFGGEQEENGSLSASASAGMLSHIPSVPSVTPNDEDARSGVSSLSA